MAVHCFNLNFFENAGILHANLFRLFSFLSSLLLFHLFFNFYIQFCSRFIHFVLILSALFSFYPRCYHFVRFVVTLSALFPFFPLCSHFIRFVIIVSTLISFYSLCYHFVRFVLILSALIPFIRFVIILSALLLFYPLFSLSALFPF